MSEFVWLGIVAATFGAAATWLVWACIRDLWDALVAVAAFIVLYGAAGSTLAVSAEQLLRFGAAPAGLSQSGLVLAGSLAAVATAVAVSCLLTFGLRRLNSAGRETA